MYLMRSLVIPTHHWPCFRWHSAHPFLVPFVLSIVIPVVSAEFDSVSQVLLPAGALPKMLPHNSRLVYSILA